MLLGTCARRLLSARYGNRLPDDDIGRRFILVLLATGTKRKTVEALAPWCSPPGMWALIDKVRTTPTSYWTGARIGSLLKLTNAERERLGLRQLWPIDRSRAQIAADVKARKQESDRERKRRNRAQWQYQHPATIEPRAMSLLSVMTDRWEPLPQVRARVPWQARNGWQSLKPDAHRQASLRELRKLVAAGLAETYQRRESGRLTTLVRRAKTAPKSP